MDRHARPAGGKRSPLIFLKLHFTFEMFYKLNSLRSQPQIVNEYPHGYATGGPKKAEFEMLKAYDPQFRDLSSSYEKMDMADGNEELLKPKLVKKIFSGARGIYIHNIANSSTAWLTQLWKTHSYRVPGIIHDGKDCKLIAQLIAAPRHGQQVCWQLRPRQAFRDG